MIELEARLAELRALGLTQRTRLVSGPQGPHVLLDGKPVLLLCSNNYLGLADHPAVREAAADAAMRWGAGAGASRLVSGTMTIHRRLEERLATFHRRQTGLLFGSGYLANTGVIAALARPGDVIFSDERNQASIVDGCHLAEAEVFVYEHGDADHLAWGIEQAEGRGALIVTDSVFATDGDVAPLTDIAELAQRHGLRTMVNEAHGVGALGPGGRGALAEAGLEDQVDVIVGTLGAALGSYGAFVVCDDAMARYLINAARTFIFSTALPPPAVAAAMAALARLESEPRRVDRLAANAGVLRTALAQEGFDIGQTRTQIVSLAIGDAAQTARIGQLALGRGVFTQPIRPPAVAPLASRLRLAVMATHREAELAAAARTLGAAARAAGFDPRASQVPVDPGLPAADIEEDAYAAAAAARVDHRPPPRARVFDFEAGEPARRAA